MQLSRIILLIVLLLTTGRLLHAGLAHAGTPKAPVLQQFTSGHHYIPCANNLHAEPELTISQAKAGSQQLIEKKDPFRGFFYLFQAGFTRLHEGNPQLIGYLHSPNLQYLYPYHNFW